MNYQGQWRECQNFTQSYNIVNIKAINFHYHKKKIYCNLVFIMGIIYFAFISARKL